MRARLVTLVLCLLLTSVVTAQEAPKRIRVGAEVLQAKLVHSVQPEYPALAQQARIQGTVRMQAIIAKDGTVAQLEVLSGHPLLQQAALRAVSQWRYQETLLNGEPIEVVSTIEVLFSEGMDSDAPNTQNAEARLYAKPDDPQAHLVMGMVQRGRGELDAAVASYRRALDLDPSLDRARRELIATLLSAKHDPEGAAAELRIWMQHKPEDVQTRQRLAQILLEIDDIDGAIAEYLELSRLPQQRDEACKQLTAAFVIKHAPEKAAAEMRRMAPHCAEPAELHAAMAEALMQRMRFASGLQQYEAALRLKPDDEKLRRQVQEFTRIQAVMTCMQQRLSVRAAANDAPAALMLAGVRFALTDEREPSLAAIRDVFKKTNDPDVLRTIGELGQVFSRIGGVDFAIREMEKLRQLRPDVESIQVSVAQLLLTRGRLDEAAAAAQQALVMNPKSMRAHELRLAVFTAKGLVEDARAEQQIAAKAREEEQQNPLPARNPFQALESELMGCEPAAMGDARMNANEASAVGSLRTLNTANVMYAATYERGFPPSLAALGPGNPPSAQAADLIDSVLASGTKSGYLFTYATGPADETGKVATYSINADPVEPGKTGGRWFYTDQSGVIRVSTTGRAGPADPPIS